MNTISQKYSNTTDSGIYLAINTMLLSCFEVVWIVGRLMPAGIFVLRCFFNNRHILRAQESPEDGVRGQSPVMRLCGVVSD